MIKEFSVLIKEFATHCATFLTHMHSEVVREIKHCDEKLTLISNPLCNTEVDDIDKIAKEAYKKGYAAALLAERDHLESLKKELDKVINTLLAMSR